MSCPKLLSVGFLMAQLIHYFLVAQISSIRNMEFAKMLWAICLGDFSVVNRKALIEEMLTNS